MSTNTQPRQPSGTPVGGRFAGKSNPESDIELTAVDWASLLTPRRGVSEDSQAEAVEIAIRKLRRGASIDNIKGFVDATAKNIESHSNQAKTPLNRIARNEWLRRCDEASQRLRRTLTVDEEDAIAAEIWDGYAISARPTKGFHRLAQEVGFDVVACSAPDPVELDEGSHLAAVVDSGLDGGYRKSMALAAIVADADGPPLVPGSVTERHAAELRRAVFRDSDGAFAEAKRWTGGWTPLCAAFGEPELSDAERQVVVDCILEHPVVAESLWSGSISAASPKFAQRYLALAA